MCTLLIARYTSCLGYSGTSCHLLLMPRRPKFEIKEQDGKWVLNLPPSFSASGKRERYVRAKLSDAKKLQREIRKRYHEFGTRASSVPSAVVEDATQAREILEPFGCSLSEAAREYAEKRKAAGATVPVCEAWEIFIATKESEGKSEAYIKDLTITLEAMPEWFLRMEVASIEGHHIEKAVDGTIKTRPLVRAATWNRRIRETGAVINHAKNTKAKERRGKKKPPNILKDNDQARLLMEIAEEEGCALPFALMLFGGIRPLGELGKITMEAIGKKSIYISHDEAKTSSDRHIPISKNLRLWIKAWGQETILPAKWHRLRTAVRKAAGIAGQQDILRHTFGSAFYRIHGEQETLQAMGHGGWQTFQAHYKRAISLEDALEFFTIAPGGKSCAAPQAIKVA